MLHSLLPCDVPSFIWNAFCRCFVSAGVLFVHVKLLVFWQVPFACVPVQFLQASACSVYHPVGALFWDV